MPAERHHVRAIALSALAGVAAAPVAPTLPAHQRLIDAGAIGSFRLTGSQTALTTGKLVATAGEEFGQALRVVVTRRATNEYNAQFELPLPNVALKKGDVIWAAVSARVLQTTDETGQGVVGLVLEQNKQPYDKLVTRRASVGKDWQDLMVPVKVGRDYPAGSLHLLLRTAYTAQTVELANVRLIRFDDPTVDVSKLPQTRSTYQGREPDAAWRAAADERIEQLRKAPIAVRVVDGGNKPVIGATVRVALRRHAFPFGSCYNVGQFVGPESRTADAEKYRRHFLELFNVGVDEYAMKWPGWEEPATRQAALKTLDWMDAHGVRVRGHCLVWPAWNRMPANVKDLQHDKQALARRVTDHVRNTAAALAGRVTEWDVINEPYVNHDLMDLLGYPAMADWFKAARAGDPNAPLFLNETSVPTSPPGDGHYDTLYEQVRLIQQHGGPVSGVGMQAHVGSSLTGMADLSKIYDRFATLGVPLQITEFDVDVQDEQLQADYMRDLITLTFAHRNSSGVMLWGFVASHHWRPDAAMFRADWTPKPAAKVWRDLVKTKWWTDQTLTTAADGSAVTRGFLGDYDVTVTLGDRTQTSRVALPKGGQSIDVVLK